MFVLFFNYNSYKKNFNFLKKNLIQLKILTTSISVLIALVLRFCIFYSQRFGLAIAYEPPAI